MAFKTLDLGYTGNEVRQIHEILMNLGYRIPKVTEEYDNYTKSAVKAFQNDNRMQVTGLVDQKTWDCIINMLPGMTGIKDSEPEQGRAEETSKKAAEQYPVTEAKAESGLAEQDSAMEVDEIIPQSNISQTHAEMPVIPQFSGVAAPEVPKVKWVAPPNMDEDDKADIGEPWAWSDDRSDEQMEFEAYKGESPGGKESMEYSEMKAGHAEEWRLNSKSKESDMTERKIRLNPVDFDPVSIQGEKYQVVRSNNTQKTIVEKEARKEALEYETENAVTKTSENIAREIDAKKAYDKSIDKTAPESKAANTAPPINYIPAISCDDEGCVGFAMVKKSRREKKNPDYRDNYTHRIDPAAPWENTSFVIPSTTRRYLNKTVTLPEEKSAKLPEADVYKEYSGETEHPSQEREAVPCEAEEKKSDKKPIWTGELRPIQWGSRNRTVNLLQRRLTELGYFKGDINGYFGFETRMAVIDLQLDRDIKADGIVDDETWKALYEVMPEDKTWPKLKMGDSGQDVVTLQKYLKEMVYYSGIEDGYFGSMTHEAAVKFQIENNMAGDGVIDDAVWGAIEKKLVGMSAIPVKE